MISNVYSVYDSKAEVYGNPFLFSSHGVAIREIGDIVNNSSSKHPFSSHPEDYTLFFVGTFNDESALFNQKAHQSLGCLIEFKSV